MNTTELLIALGSSMIIGLLLGWVFFHPMDKKPAPVPGTCQICGRSDNDKAVNTVFVMVFIAFLVAALGVIGCAIKYLWL